MKKATKTKPLIKMQIHKMQTRKPLSLVTKKKADNTDIKQYNFIGCRVKTWSKILVFLSQNLDQGCVKTCSKIFLAWFFFQFYSVLGYPKNHK